MKRVVITSDLHMPWHCKKAVKKAILFIKAKKPDVVVINGDLVDLYSFSRFPSNPNIMTPQEEIKQARDYSEKLIYDIKKASKKSKIFLTRGNHSMRLSKRITEKLPELIGIFDFDSMWMFDDVETILDPREPLEIDDALYVHGWFTKLGDTVKYFQKNVFCGHSHRPGVFYHQLNGRSIYECNSGFLADINSVPLSYVPSKISRATLGFAYKDEYGPRVITL